MAGVIAKAVVMGPESGTDSTYKFAAPDNLMDLPSDEVVEMFIHHLHDSGMLPDRNAYELNSAFKNREKRVVTGLGSLHFSNEDMPFVVMIFPTE